MTKSKTFAVKAKGKEVNVTVEFPEAGDEKAKEEFRERLKELYVEKVKAVWGQGKIPAASQFTGQEEGAPAPFVRSAHA